MRRLDRSSLLALLLAIGVWANPVMGQDAETETKPAAAANADGDTPTDAEPSNGDDAAEETAANTPEPSEIVESDNAAEMVVTPTFTINNLWIMIAGMLVFIMHLGFATLESGLTRKKNTVNIIFKNTMIICIGLLTYGVVGFNLMYPGFEEGSYGKIGFAGFDFLLNGLDATADGEFSSATYNEGYTAFTDFFFQAMFAATCATIVSGAVAGRVKLSTFLVFSTLFVSISYPITGSWQWGLGWLADIGFHDFAGSTLVHSVGGWGALVMAAMLGPRAGKYVDGQVRPIPASNVPLAAIGVFLLWFGWFGFNGGSVLNADPAGVSLVLVTTSMAAAAGGFSAAITSWICSGKPDATMALNGILAGLVGITAGADQMSGVESIVIGLIAGVIVYFAVVFVDTTLKIDDPVGAISVHLFCGIYGTLAVGLFGGKGFIHIDRKGFYVTSTFDQLIDQATGVVAIGVFTVLFCVIVGGILKATMGLRVDPEEEERGLDISEHGMEAYG